MLKRLLAFRRAWRSQQVPFRALRPCGKKPQEARSALRWRAWRAATLHRNPIGQEIDLVEDHRTGTVEKERVFFRLVVAFGHAEQGDLGVFAAIEFDGANEVPYVFDEQR